MKIFTKTTKSLFLLSGLPIDQLCQLCIFFFGSMPINFSRKHINLLYSKDYFMFEKSDGVRGILISLKRKIYLLDRNLILTKIINNSKRIDKIFLCAKTTLIDGELCFNLIIENYEYLIYDLICHCGDWRISTWDLKSRINASKYIIKKLDYFFCKFSIQLKKKDIFKINEIQNLFYRIVENNFSIDRIYINYRKKNNLICNKNDGVIFAPNKIFYISKFPFITFKWKYENGNSIDFIIKKHLKRKNKKKTIFRRLWLYSGTGNINQFKFKNIKKINYNSILKIFYLNKNENKVGEYLFNKKTSDWCFIKNRKDKKNANSIKVVINTLEIMNECFFKNELIDNLFKICLRTKRGKDFKFFN
nr:mRNA capping enzyme [Cryptomonas curvata]